MSNTGFPAISIVLLQIFPLAGQSKHSSLLSSNLCSAIASSIVVNVFGFMDSSSIMDSIRGTSSWILSHISNSLIELKSRFILKNGFGFMVLSKITELGFSLFWSSKSEGGVYNFGVASSFLWMALGNMPRMLFFQNRIDQLYFDNRSLLTDWFYDHVMDYWRSYDVKFINYQIVKWITLCNDQYYIIFTLKTGVKRPISENAPVWKSKSAQYDHVMNKIIVCHAVFDLMSF